MYDGCSYDDGDDCMHASSTVGCRKVTMYKWGIMRNGLRVCCEVVRMMNEREDTEWIRVKPVMAKK